MGKFQKSHTFQLEAFNGNNNIVISTIFESINIFAQQNKWKIVFQNSEQTKFKTSISWASWGEEVYLSYRISGNKLELHCYTENFQVISWGKLEKNVNDIMNFIIPKIQNLINIDGATR